MSVIMASTYLTVHLFGFITKDTKQVPYESMNHCTNSLELHSKKYDKDSRYQVTFDKARGYLAVSDNVDKSVQVHHCAEQP